MNGRMEFAVTAVVVLITASMVPVVGSQQEALAEQGDEQPVAGGETYTDTKMVEVPVQIHMQDGVREITKELPVETVTTLYSMLNQTRRAVQTLQTSQASSIQKQRAHEVIDTFLHTLKTHGLLGDMSVAKMKSLITGGYHKTQNDKAARPLMDLAHLLEQNGWNVRIMCYFMAWGAVGALFPYSLPILLLSNLIYNLFPSAWWWLPIFEQGLWVSLDLIPCPTTVGYWNVGRAGMFAPSGGILMGWGNMQLIINLGGGETVEVITAGFTGIILLHRHAIGFCPFIAYKHNT